MHQAQIEKGLGIAKLGGRLIQLGSSGPAPVDAPPIPVAVTQLQQRIHIPLSCQLLSCQLLSCHVTSMEGKPSRNMLVQ